MYPRPLRVAAVEWRLTMPTSSLGRSGTVLVNVPGVEKTEVPSTGITPLPLSSSLRTLSSSMKILLWQRAMKGPPSIAAIPAATSLASGSLPAVGTSVW